MSRYESSFGTLFRGSLRQLNLAVRALSLHLIDGEQFTELCSAWVEGGERSVTDLAVERGWLGTDEITLLEDALDGGVAVDAGPTPSESTIDVLAMPARYRTLRPHHQGPLSTLWVVRDDELNRNVVLKELPAEQKRNGDARARFLREARITGQLEHPNIVPVYEFGHRSDNGQPYYTMRYVHGDTLSKRINDYHRRKRRGRATKLELRRLLGAFVAVCNAIAYAHSRGVIHRDLKPANVALGRFGEVILLDWGLAKLVGQDESPTHSDLTPTDVPDFSVTRHGTVLGTPAYMSPEQANGQLDAIGPATDVYGLGAILFEILTGRPPHSGRDTGDLIESATRCRSPSASDFDPDVSRPLEAICARAMARSPARRYPRVPDLVDDVQRYLADEPVSVYSPPVAKRLGRWVRHHPTLCAVIFLATISLFLFGANLLHLTLLERQAQLVGSLEREIGRGAEVLQALKSHFLASEYVSREEFRTFVTPCLGRHPALRALEWLPVVPGADRDEYEHDARASLSPEFSFMEITPEGGLVPAAKRELYCPVYYVEPLRGNEPALGLDFISSVGRRAVLELTRARDRATVSAPVELVQGGGPGFFMLCPVGDGTAGEPAGYVLGVYHLAEILAGAWRDIPTDHLEIRICDVTDPERPYLLWTNMDGGSSAGPVEECEVKGGSLVMRVSKRLDVCGRTWQITTKARPSFLLFYPSSRL